MPPVSRRFDAPRRRVRTRDLVLAGLLFAAFTVRLFHRALIPHDRGVALPLMSRTFAMALAFSVVLRAGRAGCVAEPLPPS